MIKYSESFYKSVGAYACYFFCLVNIAEEVTGMTFDIETVIQLCSIHFNKNKTPWLTFNWDNYDDKANFDVNEPTEILYLLTGKRWSCEKVMSPTYKPKKGDYVVQHYVNGKIGHFRMKEFDSLQNSITVRDGRIDSYRVFRIIGE